MRFISTCVSILCLMSQMAAADNAPLPKRKAGLWELQMKTEHTPQPRHSKQCVDEATDAQLQKMVGDGGGPGKCEKNETKTSPEGFVTHSECSFGGSRMVSHGVFKGSFDSEYTGEVVTTFTPPLFGKDSSRIEISAKWLGACPAVMKPGDIEAEGMPPMNVIEAAEKAKAAAKLMNDPTFSKGMQDGFRDLEKLQKMMKGNHTGQ